MYYFSVYILANRERSIFFGGVTGVLEECVFDHKVHQSKRDNCWRHCTRLVFYKHFEEFQDAVDCLEDLTEKLEVLKTDFIGRFNPCWMDLGGDWYDQHELWFTRHWYSPLIPAEWQ